eukprot:366382-Chlamydomonas_euryale.AAC.6
MHRAASTHTADMHRAAGSCEKAPRRRCACMAGTDARGGRVATFATGGGLARCEHQYPLGVRRRGRFYRPPSACCNTH